jgi:hypothetical protein
MPGVGHTAYNWHGKQHVYLARARNVNVRKLKHFRQKFQL